MARASRRSLSVGLIRPYLEAYWTHEREALTARASSALGGATLLWELVKLKTPWAFHLTAFLMDPLGEILEAIAEDRADDLMAFLRPNREDLAAWVEVASAEVGALARAGMELGEAWRSGERRAFWEAVVATFPHPHQRLARKAAARAYEGRPPEAIWEEARALLRRGNVAKALASHLEEVLAGRGYRAARERAKELG